MFGFINLVSASTLIIGLVLFYNHYYFNFNKKYLNRKAWSSSFECGFIGHSVSINNFSVSFFILLIFFVVFDLEISLLLNMPTHINLYKSFFFYVCFIVLVCAGYITEVLKGFVNWQK
uniref:NADH-ubiquinone oxidoreductase chain 3 n=1 Tax=Megalobenedenia derzhavini TaxID=3068300 RepID=A0AA49QL22_9PLAT|nr:NADH dehydrogenase subunit 3 [Megalobenedenia derzhavini]WLG31373.1 NADH dehydrogenase subunit 3 [Megalobenedenia derzhavini]